VRIITGAAPVRLAGGEYVTGIELGYTKDGPDGLTTTGETFTLKADQVLKAIGQHLDGAPGALALDGGKIAVDGPGRTSVKGVWAGGDCATGGDDLTVTAVAEGRDAAEDIHATLMS
jgi:glutamate synthase (NADPH/NADH) small chain